MKAISLHAKYIIKIIILLYIYSSPCNAQKKAYYSPAYLNWQTQEKTSDKKIIHTLFIIGDAGKLNKKDSLSSDISEALKKDLSNTKSNTSLVFLGNNIYPTGMPKKEDKKRSSAENIINQQLNLAQYCNGNTYFIPGNHDWKKGEKGGLKAIQREEKYIEDYYPKSFNKKVKLYPGQGNGEPKVIKINKDLVFIFIDSQWWLENWNSEKKINKNSKIKSRGEFLDKLEDIFIEHRNDKIVFFMHHPIYSNGAHGGKLSLTSHIFPLAQKNIWIPMPFIGSLYPAYRQSIGNTQDISNTKYAKLANILKDMVKNLELDIIFASGHDHSLQFFDKDNAKYIVSGSGSQHTFTLSGGQADFVKESKGYVKIIFYEDNETWAEFYSISDSDNSASLAFKTQLTPPNAGSVNIQNKYPSILPKDTLVAANNSFGASALKKLFLGEQYRKTWTTKVNAPIIDLAHTYGGLTPEKKGGGMSSNTLRTIAPDGKEYVIRSINKDYTKLVDEKFSQLKLMNIMKDQNSASHPYGALMIPSLSKAAGIYYNTPSLVFLKKQKQLGNFNPFFPEQLYILEQRPDGKKWKDYEQYGKPDDIISYNDLLKKLKEKKSHYVDQNWVLKSRLFDLFIHDWDRHDDQWRWATFEYSDSTVYRPIPRDRDQVFYKFEGIIPWYASTFLIKKFKTMRPKIADVKNLSYNARYFDRYFLNQLSWEEWKDQISKIQINETDSIIENSINALPKEVIPLNKEIPSILESRRNDLMRAGKKLYDFLAEEVDIPGSNDEDKFIIEKNDDGSMTVSQIIPRDKKSDIYKYHRTFYPDETNEVRIYGLSDKDTFLIKGADKCKITLRIIGGDGKDIIENNTKGNNIYAYDMIDGIKMEGNKVKDKTKDDVEINRYNRKEFAYNKNLPLLRFGYTKDDGIWIGGAFNRTVQGWRHDPYKSKQKYYFLAAPKHQDAYRLGFEGTYLNIFGKIDFKPTASVDFPSIQNFFGYGNESKNNATTKEYNWVSLKSIKIAPFFIAQTYNENISIQLAPTYETYKIVSKNNRVAEDPVLGFNKNELERKDFTGFEIIQKTSVIDGEGSNPSLNPTNGFSFTAFMKYQYNTKDKDKVWTYGANNQFYFTISNYPKIIFAHNIGFESMHGNAEFYQYPNLGNINHLRGYRKNRYRGNTSFYNNMDLRVGLWDWKNHYVPANIGFLLGHDVGRVWLDHEKSKDWHQSFTIGAWFDILDTLMLQPYYSFTPEDDLLTFRMSFSF